jgi:hypothetical protein
MSCGQRERQPGPDADRLPAPGLVEFDARAARVDILRVFESRAIVVLMKLAIGNQLGTARGGAA